MGCPIRKSTDYKLFAPTRSLSQLVTSFFASRSQGIHRTSLFAFKLYNKLVYYLYALDFYRFSLNMSKIVN